MPNSSDVNEQYEKAVADVGPEFGADTVPPTPVEAPKSSWWSRLWRREQEDRFLIRPEWARETVKSCFVPLAVYHHPSWELTDGEAERARPQMQVFLQAVADRYVPAILSRFATRHAELFDLTFALALLYWVKWKVVKRAMIAEKRVQRGPVPIRSEAAAPERSPEEIAADESYVGPENVTCEKCGETFPNAREAGKHLPCPGPKKSPDVN